MNALKAMKDFRGLSQDKKKKIPAYEAVEKLNEFGLLFPNL